MSLDKKLVALSKGPETIMLKDLVGRPPAPIVAARRVTTRYGKAAIVVDIRQDGVISSVFLPNNYCETLDDDELEALIRNNYNLTVAAKDGRSKQFNVIISK